MAAAAAALSLRNPEAPLSLTVSASRTENEGKKQFTLFIVLVKWPHPDGGAAEPAAWTVSRRFSQFAALHEELGRHTTALPAFPEKTWFRSLDPGFVRRRQAKLGAYVQALAGVTAALHSRALRAFLEVDEHVPLGVSADSVLPRLTESVENVFGVNGMVYHAGDGVIVTACEDVNLLSKLDAKLSNMRLPWEDKGDGRFTPLGSVNVYARNGQMQWEQQHAECFDTPATAVAYDPLRRYVFCGLASGAVETFLASADLGSFARVSSHQVHADRVSAVHYDPARDVLVTVARDGMVCVLDVARGNALVACGTDERSWLSSCSFDGATGRAMIGTWGGAVSVYQATDEDPPRRLTRLEGHTGSVRCTHFDEASSTLFSGSFDGRVGVWHIGREGETHRSRSAGWLSGGPPHKIKAVTFSPSLNAAFAGYDSGAVAVFCVLEGRLLHAWDAHEREVRSLQWSEDMRVLLSASHDGSVRFWHFATGARVSGVHDISGAAEEEEEEEEEEKVAAVAEAEVEVQEAAVVAEKEEDIF